jgi:hypothetical protein
MPTTYVESQSVDEERNLLLDIGSPIQGAHWTFPSVLVSPARMHPPRLRPSYLQPADLPIYHQRDSLGVVRGQIDVVTRNGEVFAVVRHMDARPRSGPRRCCAAAAAVTTR